MNPNVLFPLAFALCLNAAFASGEKGPHGGHDPHVALAPDDAGVRVNRAQAYRAFDRFEEAMADLDHAVVQAPDLLPARFNRGALRFSQGAFEKALTDFDHCVALDPHAPPPPISIAPPPTRPWDAMKRPWPICNALLISAETPTGRRPPRT